MRLSNYLSFSQYDAFNKGQYVQRYLEGIKPESKYLDLGKRVAEDLEAGKETYGLPIPTEREKRILTKLGDVPLLCILDGFSEKELIIDEYKTSTTKWTQAKVDKNEQLTFYAIAISKEYDVPIENIKIRLSWLETFIDTDGELKLSGRKEILETKRDTIDMMKIYPKMKRAWEGIAELTAEWADKQIIK